MLKYNYLIRRNEGDEVREYVPNLIPTELEDLVYIQGPNSSGKSTLLNLIALGLFGEKLKEDELNPALREKIDHLRNSSHQEITFEIEIVNKVLGTTIKSIKGDLKTRDFKVTQLVGGKEKIISSNEFLNEYKLIYDIPSDPIRRLPELHKELKNSQENIENEIIRLRKRIEENIKGVKEGKDADFIKNISKEIYTLTEKHTALYAKIEDEEKILKWLKEYHNTKHYLEYTESLKQLKIKIQESKENKSMAEKKEKTLSKQEAELMKRIKFRIELATARYNMVTNLLKLLLPSELKNHLTIWENLKCMDEIKEPHNHLELREETRYFLNYFRNLQTEDENNIISESKFLTNLSALLNEYRDTNISVPGTGFKISKFIELLDQELKKKESQINRNENITDCIENLVDLQNILNASLDDYEKQKKLKSKYYDALTALNDETEEGIIEKLENEKFTIEKNLSNYSGELYKLGIHTNDARKKFTALKEQAPYFNFNKYTELQLSQAILLRESENRADKISLSTLKKEIEVKKNEKSKNEQKKPHKYQMYLTQLEKAHKIFQSLESKFSNNFRDNIKKMMEKDVKYEKLSKPEQEYSNRVAEYLAKKVRFIKHIDKNHEIAKIDIISKEILTTKGKIIKFTDLGTGQGQGAYLGGLLSMNENKKIIALFDEVAMMDTQTLEPIFDKLKALYSAKKLLLGVIVQKAEKIEVTPLI